MYLSPTGETYWARIIVDETLLSFLFTVIYLVVRFESSMHKVDRIIKGFAMTMTFFACLLMTNSSGATFNPALGFAQSIYMIGYIGSVGGSTNLAARYMWVYMIFPFVGAGLAALFFTLH
jgi:glycerol uptake facilitator-like aquaporin